MRADRVIREARRRTGLTLRALAARARTSHSTIAAYESGSKVPTTETLDRIVRAAGLDIHVELRPLPGGTDRAERGRELAEALRLAERFPARHSPTIDHPRFGPRA